MPRPPRRVDWPLLAFLLACGAYWGALIWVQSGIIEGRRWFCLFDDAMISMRYAKNLAQGMGAVFNAGQRVEGFSNPLWMLAMAAVHLVVKDPATTSLAVQVIGALLLGGTVLQAGRLALLLSDDDRFARWATMLLCATFYPLNFWTLHGMEVGLLAFLATLAAVQATQAVKSARFSAWPAVLLAVAMLARADALVLAVALTLSCLGACRLRPIRPVLAAGGAILASALLQTGTRLAYYGRWLPNTYDLKMTGIPPLVRAGYGVFVLAHFLQDIFWLPALLVAAAPLLRRSRLLVPSLGLIGAQVAYDIWVGGDAWETPAIGANRFLSTVAPIAIALSAVAARDAVDWLIGHLEAPSWRLERLRGAFAGLLLAIVGATATGAFQLQHLRLMLALDPDRDALTCQHFIRQALALEPLAGPQATVAVTNAGTLPYFFDRTTIDILGKMDPHIARLPMHPISSPDAWWPGHMKFDQAYSIGVLKPDIVTGVWRDDRSVVSLLKRDFVWHEATSSWFRSGSPNLRLPNAPHANRTP